MAFDGTAATNTETISYSGANNIWTCTVVAHDSDADGAVTFSLGFSDAAGNAGVAVTATTDSSAVTHDDTVPTLTNVVESVNGAGNGNNGDTVTLTITPSEAIQQPVCTFQSGGANMANSQYYGTGAGNVRTCSIVVADGDTNGAVTFSIAFDDTAGNAGVAVTTPSSGAVTIDNTHPTASAAVLAVGGTGNGNNGDSITLTITPSETIGTPTCVFKSGGVAMANTVGYSTSGGDHICTIAVADGDTDGTVTFTLDFSDSAGNAASQVTSPSSGAVTIDNTHPTLNTPCLLYTSPSPRDATLSRMPSSA